MGRRAKFSELKVYDQNITQKNENKTKQVEGNNQIKKITEQMKIKNSRKTYATNPPKKATGPPPISRIFR